MREREHLYSIGTWETVHKQFHNGPDECLNNITEFTDINEDVEDKSRQLWGLGAIVQTELSKINTHLRAFQEMDEQKKDEERERDREMKEKETNEEDVGEDSKVQKKLREEWWNLMDGKWEVKNYNLNFLQQFRRERNFEERRNIQV